MHRAPSSDFSSQTHSTTACRLGGCAVSCSGSRVDLAAYAMKIEADRAIFYWACGLFHLYTVHPWRSSGFADHLGCHQRTFHLGGTCRQFKNDQSSAVRLVQQRPRQRAKEHHKTQQAVVECVCDEKYAERRAVHKATPRYRISRVFLEYFCSANSSTAATRPR
jgi:hypothetical protein